MSKLTDNNPYEILEIPIQADKKAITKAFMQKNRGNNQDRRLVRQAYDALRKSEDHLLVDALTPIFSIDGKEEEIAEEIVDEIKNLLPEKVDWLAYLDGSKIQKEDLLALTEAMIRHFFTEIPPPLDSIEIQSDYDGLQEFITEWLE
jgi:hypothetical protein